MTSLLNHKYEIKREEELIVTAGCVGAVRKC